MEKGKSESSLPVWVIVAFIHIRSDSLTQRDQLSNVPTQAGRQAAITDKLSAPQDSIFFGF